MATVDPMGKESESVCPLNIFIGFMCVGSMFIWGNRPHIGLLNNILAELSRPEPIGVDIICNRARLTSCLVLRLF